jgi:hypothetical protein
MGDRLVRVEAGSSDVVALRDGSYRHLELKTRCDHGTKSGAATAEIAADLERVGTFADFTFLAVLDGGIYRSFSDSKTERRGRKAMLPELTSIFPPIDDLKPGSAVAAHFDFKGTRFEALVVRQEVPGNGPRVIVAVNRAQAM